MADDGRGGVDAATVTVEVIPVVQSISLTYLSLVLRDDVLAPFPPGPDLVVVRVVATSEDVQVLIRNQGDRPVQQSDAFWVDLYVDPDPAPTGVNQTWESLSAEGAVWGIPRSALPLPPGGEIALAIGDGYYWPSISNFSGSLPAGTPVYVQVDSAHAETTYGAVLERHEMAGGTYNNIAGPVLSGLAVAGGGPAGSPGPVERYPGLPPRP